MLRTPRNDGCLLSHIRIHFSLEIQASGIAVTGIYFVITAKVTQPHQRFPKGGPAAAGQVGPSAGPPEQGVAGEDHIFTQQTDAAGSVTGGV